MLQKKERLDIRQECSFKWGRLKRLSLLLGVRGRATNQGLDCNPLHSKEYLGSVSHMKKCGRHGTAWTLLEGPRWDEEP